MKNAIQSLPLTRIRLTPTHSTVAGQKGALRKTPNADKSGAEIAPFIHYGTTIAQ
jgi:hypothetical protein